MATQHTCKLFTQAFTPSRFFGSEIAGNHCTTGTSGKCVRCTPNSGHLHIAETESRPVQIFSFITASRTARSI